jgi:hypothetical protein
MRNQNRFKYPNAQKHGVFAATAILPGEDHGEFKKLLSDLLAKWTPNGPTEEEAVLSIAKAVWRKRRLQKFLDVQVAKNQLDPSHKAFDISFGLRSLVALLKFSPETAFDEYASRFLRPDKVSFLKSKYPRSKYKSAEDWAKALIDEIKAMPETQRLPREAEDVAKLFLSCEAVSHELFQQELTLDERLDVMIDRAVKRLIQIKAMKQMLDQTSAGRSADQPKRIESKTARSD